MVMVWYRYQTYLSLRATRRQKKARIWIRQNGSNPLDFMCATLTVPEHVETSSLPCYDLACPNYPCPRHLCLIDGLILPVIKFR